LANNFHCMECSIPWTAQATRWRVPSCSVIILEWFLLVLRYSTMAQCTDDDVKVLKCQHHCPLWTDSASATPVLNSVTLFPSAQTWLLFHS
jgi:hypothetical protein